MISRQNRLSSGRNINASLFPCTRERRYFFMSFQNTASSSPVSFKSSPLANTRVLTGLALFLALYTVLRFVSINLTPTLRVSFSFLALAASCMCYGLWPNLILAFFCDFLGFAVHPDGAYMPLFALVIMARAVIYSAFFYNRKQISIGRILIAQLLTTILCSLILNPMLLSFMYQTPFWSLLPQRLLKNAILYPIECGLLYLVLQSVLKIRRRVKF